ncbi:unnamed protein product [Symbiodinium microadriaticum]|nr:unnamed protein product [Symbiodinium microadriaticum]
MQAAQRVAVPDMPATPEGLPAAVEDRLYQSMMSSVDQAYHDVPLFLHCLTEQVERTLGGDAQQKEDEIALSGLEEYLSAAFDDAICQGSAPGRPVAPPAETESGTHAALKHRFYPFAPGVAPEELEQLLLIHAFEDLLAKAQPERSWCCADRIWREQIPSSLLGQTLEAALRSEPFADAAYLPRHDALLLALHHRAAPGRVLWHAWQGDLLADPQDIIRAASGLVLCCGSRWSCSSLLRSSTGLET